MSATETLDLGAGWTVRCSPDAAAYLRSFAAWLEGPTEAPMPSAEALPESVRQEVGVVLGRRLHDLEADAQSGEVE